MRLYSAPMAGYTNYAFRELLRMFGGTDLIATEMISARSFVELETRGLSPPSRLWGVREEPRPLAVQIWDNDPNTLAGFAQKLAADFQVSVIDLNFGCPAKQIAGKSASGSYLLQYPDKIGDIVRRVVQAAGLVPVTAKIRLGRTRDTINAIDVAQSIEDAGGAALTVHGRTAADMYRGKADWDEIARIKPKLRSIPLIGNGDITTVDEALFRLRNYPVDGLMIGRGGVAKPWLFKQIKQAFNNAPTDSEPEPVELCRIIENHFTALQRQFNENVALMLSRKMVGRFAAAKSGARKLRNDVCEARSGEAFLRIIREYFGAAGWNNNR